MFGKWKKSPVPHSKSKYELFFDKIKARLTRRKDVLRNEIKVLRRKEDLEKAKLTGEIKLIKLQSRYTVIKSLVFTVTTLWAAISLLFGIPPSMGSPSELPQAPGPAPSVLRVPDPHAKPEDQDTKPEDQDANPPDKGSTGFTTA